MFIVFLMWTVAAAFAFVISTNGPNDDLKVGHLLGFGVWLAPFLMMLTLTK